MSLVTRVAIRFAQILALTLLLAGLIGGATVTRAAEIEVDCGEAADWIAETIERSQDLAAHGKKVDEATYGGDLDQAYALWIEAIDLLADAAEEQADSDPPSGLEDVNDDLAEAYADAAQAASEFIAAIQAPDQLAMNRAYEDVMDATRAANSAMDVVLDVEEACEGGENRGDGRDRGDDPDPDPSGDLTVEVNGEIVDEQGGDPLKEATMLVFKAGVACDEIDFEALAEGESDQFLLGAVTDRSGEFALELEVEVSGEYAVVFTAQGYLGLCQDEVVFAEDEDAEEFDFGTVELAEAEAE